MVPKASKSVQKFSLTDEHTNNTNYELQYTRWLLTILGVWHIITNNVTKIAKISSFMLLSVSILSIFFVLIPMFVFLRTKTLRTRLAFIGPISFRISNLLKLSTMIYRAGGIKECIEHINCDWLDVIIKEEENVMLKSVNWGRSLTNICAIFMFSSGTFFHVGMPLLKPKRVDAFNVTIRPLLYPGYDYFVNSQATPAYELIFAGDCFSAASGYTIVTATCTLAAVFVAHVSGQVEVIKLKLERLHRCESYEKIDDMSQQIAAIVRCHVKIMRFSGNIRTVLGEICLLEVVLSTIVICWLEFYCMTEWHNSDITSIITYFLLLVSLTFNIFIYCYIGQILTDQCESVGLMTYMIDWHRIPTTNILSLALIISMTRYPRTITAGGMMELTISSFGEVMKASLAYLNMLRAFVG